jgi:hypothetical protein
MKNIADYLEAKAKTDEFIYYSDLAARFGLPPMDGAWAAHPLCDVFGQLDQFDETNKRPYRTSLVIGKEANMPGQGFFDTLSGLRGTDLPKSEDQKYAVWLNEVAQLRKFYSQL